MNVKRQMRTRPAIEELEGRELMASAILHGAAAVSLLDGTRAQTRPVELASVFAAPLGRQAVTQTTGGVIAAGITTKSSLQATSLTLAVSPSKTPGAGSRVTFTATLQTADKTHKPLAGQLLNFSYTGGNATLKTNSNGQVSITLVAPKKGYALIVQVKFVASAPYNGNTTSMQIVSK
jgi:hypothetical protein